MSLGFAVHIKVMFALYCSLLNVQQHGVQKSTYQFKNAVLLKKKSAKHRMSL